MQLHYRRDIDGLRAIAVLLVVLFHVHPREITGGFIGVDVFFVISGFLITGLICSRLQDQSFSLLEFYARRIRRIFPALTIVLAVSMVAGWLVLLPADYRDLGKHVAASAVFLVNFTLWQDAGYFAAPSEFKPVLHLWSLGIEEQFYILWPTLMLLTWSRRRAPFILAGAILAVSFVWNLALSSSNPDAAFFLPTTRFWELMVGCMLALGLPDFGKRTLTERWWDSAENVIRDSASLLGTFLVIAGAVLIRGRSSFPGWWALLPTMGTALLIAAGPGALVNRHMLSRPVLVQLGLISYPLYLWHWPILVFMRHYQLKDPSDLMRWGGIALAIVLAGLTYRFVEKPIRYGSPIALKPLGAAFAMALIGWAGIVVFAHAGYQGRFPKGIAVLLNNDDNAAKIFGSGYCARGGQEAGFKFTSDCESAAGTDLRRIVVWGDSHGSHLARGLIEIERARPNFHFIFFTTPGCPPIPSFPYLDPKLPNCRTSNRIAGEKIEMLKPDTVILAADWGSYDGSSRLGLVDQQSVREVMQRLKSLGIKRIVAIGQFPLWSYAVPKLVAREYRRGLVTVTANGTVAPMRNRSYLEPKTFAADRRVQQWFLSEGATFVSPLSTLCNDDGCLLTVPGRIEPIYRDQDHFTNAGSIWFAAYTAQKLLGELW